MRVLRAQHLGMCFGVRDAIAFARTEARIQPLTILGELVHNETVLDELRVLGIQFRRDVQAVETSRVMITAHGASERRRAAARAAGLSILDATCPLVRRAQRAVADLARQGFHPVVVGRRTHVEVLGMTEDLAAFDVVLDDDDVFRLEERDRFGVAAQTTQPADRVQRLASLIARRFPRAEVRLADTACMPTRHRQQAALELAQQCDVTIVVGGAGSNNTAELAATCRSRCERVFHVQTAGDLRAEWLDGARVVGVTAGTSTPDAVIDQVEARLRDLVRGRLAAA
jgi:4-hydroxy-3-methylbut-2-en-1-yl diphosphate reductase